MRTNNNYIQQTRFDIATILQQQFMDKYVISQYSLAKHINVPSNRINDLLTAKRSISADTDLRLCKFFNLENGYFLNLQNKMHLNYAQKEIAAKLKQIPICLKCK